ncbi:MAG: hypothetical protein ACLUJM_03805 [Finegoldia sp.]|uniref:hypothetical protein n=1 Tax=Finegoldia sp. TaxID=1981334 RepID=UPI0039954A1B
MAEYLNDLQKFIKFSTNENDEVINENIYENFLEISEKTYCLFDCFIYHNIFYTALYKLDSFIEKIIFEREIKEITDTDNILLFKFSKKELSDLLYKKDLELIGFDIKYRDIWLLKGLLYSLDINGLLRVENLLKKGVRGYKIFEYETNIKIKEPKFPFLRIIDLKNNFKTTLTKDEINNHLISDLYFKSPMDRVKKQFNVYIKILNDRNTYYKTRVQYLNVINNALNMTDKELIGRLVELEE